jgi:peptidyl-prolyl cis-trans isomerase C
MLKVAAAACLLAGSAGAMELTPVSCAPQTYAAEALRYEMEGTVLLAFALDKDGSPVDPQLRQTSGYGLLDREAIHHISRCKFAATGAAPGTPHTATVVWRLPEARAEVKPRLLPATCLNTPRVFAPVKAGKGGDHLTLRTQVWPDGQPFTAKVERSSSDAEVDALAVDYLEHCRFSPALRAGQPVQGAVLVTVPLDRTQFDEEAVRRLYENLSANMRLQKEHKVAHILYADESAARKGIQALQTGARFGALARQDSLDKASGKVDGELGWITRLDATPAFAAALQAQTAPGLIEHPVKTSFGWHVILSEAIRPVTPPAYEAVRERLRSRLIRETDVVVQAPPAPLSSRQ